MKMNKNEIIIQTRQNMACLVHFREFKKENRGEKNKGNTAYIELKKGKNKERRKKRIFVSTGDWEHRFNSFFPDSILHPNKHTRDEGN